MSDEVTRNTRSIRFKNDFRNIRKQLALAKTFSVPVPENKVHRLSKLKVLNCGDPTCLMCANPRKIHKGSNKKSLTVQELRHYHIKEEGLEEILDFS